MEATKISRHKNHVLRNLNVIAVQQICYYIITTQPYTHSIPQLKLRNFACKHRVRNCVKHITASQKQRLLQFIILMGTTHPNNIILTLNYRSLGWTQCLNCNKSAQSRRRVTAKLKITTLLCFCVLSKPITFHGVICMGAKLWKPPRETTNMMYFRS